MHTGIVVNIAFSLIINFVAWFNKLMVLLVCTSCNLLYLQDACLLGSFEDGLNGLLNIEVSSVSANVLHHFLILFQVFFFTF